MQAAFQTAARRIERPQQKVLGLPLRPFTLGHLFLLEEMECSFLPESTNEPELSDLTTAVFVCSQDHRSATKNFQRWWTPLFFRFWGWRCRNLLFIAEALNFLDYLREAFDLPPCRGKGRKLESGKVPRSWALLNMLMVDYGMSYEDALDTPLARAHCLSVIEAERRGTAEVLSARQRWFQDWVKEQERIRLEGENSQSPIANSQELGGA